MARRRTAEAYKKHGHWRDAIEELRVDTTLEEPARKLALQIANSRKWEDARKVVNELYEKRGLYHDVIAELQANTDLDEPVRTEALEIANYHLWLDAEKLMREARTMVAPDRSMEVYRAALAKAQQANGCEPNAPTILDILGVAQYRVGLYEEALKTFKRVAELKANEGEVRSPFTLAFTAMALHRLGRVGEAKSTLEEMRALHKENERIANLEALLAEAEEVIGSKEP
jgi:tetratricopeptide (TPR) repeat protein